MLNAFDRQDGARPCWLSGGRPVATLGSIPAGSRLSYRRIALIHSGLAVCFLLGPFAHAQSEPSPRFDPAKVLNLEQAKTIRAILRRPAEEIDLAQAKFVIDRMIDSSIDIEGGLKKIDAMTAEVRTMPEFGASGTSRLLALKRYLYEPGPWNDRRPFRYDLDDPLGANIRHKTLSSYLASRKGNCVSMPLLFVILGQRIGIEATLTTAPKHLLVKFKDERGIWINLETTSGANPARDVWIREQMPMTDQAIANGVYLQPLTKKEVVTVMAGTVAEYYIQQRDYEKSIAIADLILEYYPKDVSAMTMKAVSYGRLARRDFVEKYPTPGQIPEHQRERFQHLSRNNQLWFAKAEALGWREETKQNNREYLQRIEKVRTPGALN